MRTLEMAKKMCVNRPYLSKKTTFGLFTHKNRVSVVDTFCNNMRRFSPKLSEWVSSEFTLYMKTTFAFL
jgi:hypothetical protein